MFALAFAFVQWWDFTVPSPFHAEYQAVFLVNGQTYFGRYHERFGPFVKIEEAYYIQETPDPDPTKPAQTRLVRRGGELHGPQSRMLIPRATVLFVEDLSPGSPIAQFMTQDRAKR